MRQIIAFVSALIIFSSKVIAVEERSLEGNLTVGKHFSFYSEVLGETQNYTVILPANYAENPTKKVPVVYMLDGHESPVMLANTVMRVNYETGPMRVPEAIIVGIPSNNRFRDYTPVHSLKDNKGEIQDWMKETGGADLYRDYLKKELFPHIEKHYRASAHKIIIGHSLGGLFALYDMLSEDRLFQSYVTIDPSLWFADNYLETKARAMETGQLNFAGSLYLAIALKGAESSSWDEGASLLFKHIEENKTAKLHARKHNFENENHSSIVLSGFHNGLRYVFEGYQPPSADEIAKNPVLIVDHFQAFSARVGAEYLPDDWWVSLSGDAALKGKLSDNALELFELNVKNFPNFSGAWLELGAYYAGIDKLDEARVAFARALELDPGNPKIKAQMEEFSPK